MTTQRIVSLAGLLFILALPGVIQAQAGTFPPYLQTSGDSVNVFVSAELYQELRTAAPGVTIANADVRPTPHSAPDGFASESPTEGAVVMGDFNGDGTDDLAVHGTDGENDLVLVALSDKPKKKFKSGKVHSSKKAKGPGAPKAKLSLERGGGGQPSTLALITGPNRGFRFRYDRGAGRWRTSALGG
jgi:hypothetical protein